MSGRLKISRAGVELIKSFEGLRQVAAKLPDGRWTLGYGHTFSAREGARVGPEDADALLRFDLLPIVDGINGLVHHPLNQNQFDALVSFCFNIGMDNFAQSVVLKRINEGRLTEAALAMDSWSSAEFNGQTYVLAPLIRRRAAEKSLFLTPTEDEATAPQLSPGMVVRPADDHQPVLAPVQTPVAPQPPVPQLSVPQPVASAAPVLDTPYGARAVDIVRYPPASTVATGGEDDVPIMSESVQAALMKAQAEAKMRDDFERLDAVRAADDARRAEEARRLEEDARRANEDRLREEAMRQAQALAAARVAEQTRLEQERQAQEMAKEAARQELIRQEAARLDAARQEVARLEAAKADAERIERDRLIEQERQRLESERLEAQRFEAARRLEAQRLEAERLEAIRQEAARETARAEAARAEALRTEIARQETERREAERAEQERLATEARAQEVARLEAARLEAFRQEQARLEQERLAEQARLEQTRLEQERLEREAQAAIAEQRERDAEAARLKTEADARAREQAAAEASAAAAVVATTATPSAEEQQRKAEAAAALMRLYSPYASGLGQPLAGKPLPQAKPVPPVAVTPRPEPAPIPAPVQDIAPAPAATLQPEEGVRPAPDLTFQDEAELVARRNPSSVAPPVLIAQPPVSPAVAAASASPGLHWREQLNRPVAASAEASSAAMAPVTVVETFEEVPAPVYRTHEVTEEAAVDDDEWLSDGGRISMSVDADVDSDKSIWKMFASTLVWIGTSVVGLAAIGGATAAYYKSTSDVELRDGTTDFNSLSIILAVAGMFMVCISVYLILKRLGGLKD
ncbi:glycoside hydrolase family protein [Asticcacaulis endophyticus]|uniref:Lysozyme n=1 Tax=Asticcacaulis endophyticus TaxID=1395890 RepID=A0A918UYU3_9CAUL|nr:glycoside hydrolase family protein [Asticcacaulis endophyticus]GGZ43059.1 hypothetical protein GCM10011273_32290 [Asticcacaulis endophyticus]